VFALVGRPRGFDSDDPQFVEGVMAITGPLPLFRLFDEAALHRIAVDVLESRDEFIVVADVAVVIASLPEGTWDRNRLLNESFKE
jgi:hypothetical protein